MGCFIAAHRWEELQDPGLDLVYDRMADSKGREISAAVENFMENAAGSEDYLMKILSQQNAENSDYDQYCFKTQRAVDLLVCSGVYVISGDRNNPATRWKEASEFYEQYGL